MNTTIHVGNNIGGVVNTGTNATIQVLTSKNENQIPNDINWETVNQEINNLKSSPDSSIKKFAREAEKSAEKGDKHGLLKTLSKWIPCIGDLISSSYYILEIAKTFKIG